MARMVDLHGGHLVSHERTEEVQFACNICSNFKISGLSVKLVLCILRLLTVRINVGNIDESWHWK